MLAGGWQEEVARKFLYVITGVSAEQREDERSEVARTADARKLEESKTRKKRGKLFFGEINRHRLGRRS